MRTISSNSVYFGFQPRSRIAFSELATSTAGSPERRGCTSAGIGCPVTRRADSITSRHAEALSITKVVDERTKVVAPIFRRFGVLSRASSAKRWASARSETWM